jgi:hypothetical protein
MLTIVGLALHACGRDGQTTADAGEPRPDGDVDATSHSSDDGGSTDGGGEVDGDLPSGNEGIAGGYPGDVGIGGDPHVIFTDDFESYADGSALGSHWDDVYHDPQIATAPADVHGGGQALELAVPMQGDELSNTVAKRLTDELDVLFLRYYARYDAGFDVVGSSHNGGGISAHYYVDGRATPGVPADGLNKFLVEFEAWRGEEQEPNPGRLNVYIYHPEQRSEWGDHFFPDGTVLPDSSISGDFGPEFVVRDNVVPEVGRWYCYEVMLRANTPSARDGRIALWLDGTLIADFRNLRLRDVDSLRIDRFNLSLHIGSNTRAPARKWYDDVVAATSYIGPVFER